jgi:hypothetical protein
VHTLLLLMDEGRGCSELPSCPLLLNSCWFNAENACPSSRQLRECWRAFAAAGAQQHAALLLLLLFQRVCDAAGVDQR